jgi:hypothetical protein
MLQRRVKIKSRFFFARQLWRHGFSMSNSYNFASTIGQSRKTPRTTHMIMYLIFLDGYSLHQRIIYLFLNVGPSLFWWNWQHYATKYPAMPKRTHAAISTIVLYLVLNHNVTIKKNTRSLFVVCITSLITDGNGAKLGVNCIRASKKWGNIKTFLTWSQWLAKCCSLGRDHCLFYTPSVSRYKPYTFSEKNSRI